MNILVQSPHGVIIPHHRGHQDWAAGGGDGPEPPVDPHTPHRLLGHGLIQEIGQQEEDEHDEEGGQDGETPAKHREQQGPGLGGVPEYEYVLSKHFVPKI